MTRSKVKSRSHHDVAHLQPLTNVPATYQLPTPYGCRDIAQTRFSNSRSLRQGQRSNQGQTMTLHTYIPQPMSLPSMNFLHLTVSEIQSGQTISRRPPTHLPAHPDTMGENNTPRALKGCGIKMMISGLGTKKLTLPVNRFPWYCFYILKVYRNYFWDETLF